MTSQQRRNIKDIIEESVNDSRFLATLAKCVADIVLDKMNDKFDSLLLKTDVLQEKVNTLQAENNDLRKRMNRLEQNQRMRRLRFTGVREGDKEDVMQSITHLLTNKLNLASSDIHIEKCYRIPVKDKNKVRPVIIDFSTQKCRDLVYNRKNKLRGSTIIINEDLTQFNYKLLNSCKSTFGQKNVWSRNGRIYVSSVAGGKKMIECAEDLKD